MARLCCLGKSCCCRHKDIGRHRLIRVVAIAAIARFRIAAPLTFGRFLTFTAGVGDAAQFRRDKTCQYHFFSAASSLPEARRLRAQDSRRHFSIVASGASWLRRRANSAISAAAFSCHGVADDYARFAWRYRPSTSASARRHSGP